MTKNNIKREEILFRINENEKITREMDEFENSFSKSKSFIMGIGASKQLEKIMSNDNYNSLIEVERKTINKMFMILVGACILIFIILTIVGMSTGWSISLALIISLWFIFGSKSMSSSLESKRIFNENRKSIERFYSSNIKIHENISFILENVKEYILDYCKNKAIVSPDGIRDNNLEFLPDIYIHMIMNEEVKKGNYEVIKAPSITGKGNMPSCLYKSKTSEESLETMVIELS